MKITSTQTWITVFVVTILSLAGGYQLYISSTGFVYSDNIGVKSDYNKGYYKLYDDGKLFEDYIKVFYETNDNLEQMKVLKYNKIEYTQFGGNTILRQRINMQYGVLERYFSIKDGYVKEGFNFIPTEPDLKSQFIWEYRNIANKKTEMLLNTCQYTIKDGVILDWCVEKDNIESATLFKGILAIKTRMYVGNVHFDPEVVFTVNDNINITIHSPLEQTYNTTNITVNISTSNDSVIDTITFYNGTANLTYTVPTYYTFIKGEHTVIVYVNDTSGNINQSSVTFTVDNTGPSLVVNSPTETLYTNASIVVNLTVTDASSAVDTIVVYNGTVNITYTDVVSLKLVGREHTFIFYANDTLGNTNETSVSFNISPIVANNVTLLPIPTDSNVNLTCYYTLEGSATTQAIAWYKSGTPFNILYLPMEGNSSNAALDYSGTGYDGTVNGATWNSTGRTTGSYVFDGDNDNISLGDITELNSVTEFTVSFWAKQDVIPDWGYVLWKQRNTTETLYVYTTPAGLIYTVLGSGSDSSFAYFNYTMNTNVTAGDWFMITVVYNGSQSTNATRLKMYFNETEQELTFGSVDIPTSTPNLTGIDTTLGRNSFSWDGQLDDVRINSKALSPEQIEALYNDQMDLIVSQETSIGDTWECRVTPFDSVLAGTADGSLNVTIENITTSCLSATDIYVTIPSTYTSNDILLIEWSTDNRSSVSASTSNVVGNGTPNTLSETEGLPVSVTDLAMNGYFTQTNKIILGLINLPNHQVNEFYTPIRTNASAGTVGEITINTSKWMTELGISGEVFREESVRIYMTTIDGGYVSTPNTNNELYFGCN